ncbi:MAG: hypothetical protein U0836_27545 [Pirellulales bacterium]
MNQPAYDEDEAVHYEPETSKRPAARFSGSGGLSVAIWKQQGEKGPRYTVRLDRSYKNAEGEYQSTPYLGERDLLRAGQLLQQADAWIEQERQKQRGGGQESGRGR